MGQCFIASTSDKVNIQYGGYYDRQLHRELLEVITFMNQVLANVLGDMMSVQLRVRSAI